MAEFVNALFQRERVIHIDMRQCTSDIMPVTMDDLHFLDEFHWCRYWLMPRAQVLVIAVETDVETSMETPIDSPLSDE